MTPGPSPQMLTWLTCKRCGLHRYRRKVVLGRGPIPADLMFIGEGPGRSEDLRGEAFYGRSGRLLNAGVLLAVQLAGLSRTPTCYFTNVVGCHPCNARGGDNREPTGEEALACWPRLEQTDHAVRPKQVILLGRVAERFCKQAFPGAIHLVHPAYILRRGGEASTEFRTFSRDLAGVFERVMRKKPRRIGRK